MRGALWTIAAALFAALVTLGPGWVAAFPSRGIIIGGGGGGGGGASVPCAVGPNAASVPANAALAGFNTCLFDMEPTVAGGFWTNTANYITNCNNSLTTVAGNPAKWYFGFGTSFVNSSLPCGQSSIVTDSVGGQAALNLFEAGGNVGMALNWPRPYAGSGNGYLSLGHYDKIIFRTDCNTWYQNGGSCSSGPSNGEVAFWSSMANTLPYVDEDMWESIYGPCCGGIGLTGPGWCSYNGYHDSGGNNGGIGSAGDEICYGPSVNPTVDMTQYHTIETLWTSNAGSGSNSLVLCNWVDGTFIRCINDTPAAGPVYTDYTREIFISVNLVLGGTAPDNMNIWIRAWEEFSCSLVGAGVCSGSTLVNGPPPALTYWH